MANSRTNKVYQEYLLVLSGNQAMEKSGSLNVAGTDTGLVAGQLGAVAATKTTTYSQGDFVTGTPAITDISKLKLVQGTSKSASTVGLKGHHVGEVPAFVESAVIDGNNVQSFTAVKPVTPELSAIEFTSLPTVASNTRYTINWKLRSVRRDRDYGANIDQGTVAFKTASLTGISDSKDYLIKSLLARFNFHSRLNTIVPTWEQPMGYKPFVGLAINPTGGGGTPIGAVALNDRIRIQKNTTTGEYLYLDVDKRMLQTFYRMITNSSSITASSTIEIIDSSNAGQGARATGTITITNNGNLGLDTFQVNGVDLVEATDWTDGATAADSAVALAAAINANVTGVEAWADSNTVKIIADAGGTAANSFTLTYTDSGSGTAATVTGSGTLTGGAATDTTMFTLIALQEEISPAHDDIWSISPDISDTTIGEGFNLNETKTIISYPIDEEGTYRSLKIGYDRRAFAQRGTQQLAGHSDQLLLPTQFLDENTLYTQYITDLKDVHYVNNTPQHWNIRVRIVVPATDDSSSTTAASGITTSTNAATTLTDLNNIVGTWLKSVPGIEILGDATSTLFV